MMQYIFVLLTALFLASVNALVTYDQEAIVKTNLPEEAFFTCICHGRTDKRNFPREDILPFFNGLVGVNIQGLGFSAFGFFNHNAEIAGMMEECSKCTATITSCSPLWNISSFCMLNEMRIQYDDNSLDSDDEEMRAQFDENSVDLEDGKMRNRVRRGFYVKGRCNVPRKMKTFLLACTEYGSSVKCTQKCIFGYTLPEGISRDVQCRYAENVWKPSGFEECSPFVDCTMSLMSAGSVRCQLGTTVTPSECNVSCMSYEDKPAVPMARYVCDINGKWDKTPPHCVHLGSGFATVPAPRIKLHAFQENTHRETNKAQKQIPNTKGKQSAAKKFIQDKETKLSVSTHSVST